MHDLNNDYEELEESQFPAFPVVFQQELEEERSGNSPTNQKQQEKKQFKLPENEVKELFNLIEIAHESTYPDLFQESWENGQHSIQNFFNLYNPLNKSFVEELKIIREKLSIIRLSGNKIYIGQFVEGKCHGKGILIFKNGNIYEGQMNDNKRNGTGFYLQNGVGWYEGHFLNDLKSEEGVEIFYKKNAYKGGFLNGLRNDKGLFVDKSDNIYYGSWKLGIIHGKGTLKTSNSIFNGIFVNSLKHGNGQQKFVNGDTFKGEYQNNRFDGFGSYAWKAGDATYEGSFKNGLRHGKGKWSSGQTKYSGGYSEGLKQGYGELYFPSGNFYKGNFIEDKRQGYGEMFWTDGSFYKGDWKGGIQNGKGQIYLVGGEIISGLFQNSILVQITPSIYEKQMQISNMGIQDLFGSKPNLSNANKTRTYSESKNIGIKKRLAKIDENSKTKKNTIKDHMYFKSPDHRNHHHASHSRSKQHNQLGGGRQCKCIKRLQNFRLRQRTKTKMNQSNVQNTFNHEH